MAIGDGVSAIAQLTLTFGGFSPTAMDGVEATREHIERVQEAQARKREADERRREIERARASSSKRYTDESGVAWTYTILDHEFIRIESCKREVPDIVIPSVVEGLPVRAVGSDIFHESDVVESIVCPDNVELIAACAFRFLANLKRVVFPKNVSTFSGSWLQHCSSLEEVTLPGMLDVMTSAVFENQSLRKLRVGAAMMGVKPGACEKTQLEELHIDESNPFICTDGDAIYTRDMRELVALARPVQAYRVADGCVSTRKKACMGITSLSAVTLPGSLEEIGEFSFAHTGIPHIDIPPSVKVIREKAFFHCSKLRSVSLPEGLRELRDSAFAESALESIFIPASIQKIGSSVTAGTNVVHSGDGVTFAISEDATALRFDGQGGLYRREDDGLHFIQLIDPLETCYEIIGGTTRIDDHAFAFHNAIERVTLPEGVKEIGKSAFRVCPKLRSVSMPETLRSIGKEAFLDTNIESVYLPAGFEDLGEDALVTAGAHRLGEPPSLRSITVSPDNERYYVDSGLLCRRGPDGDRGIVFNDAVADVVIPDRVTTIAPFAFCNARNIETFSIGPNLKTIGSSGFSTWCFIGDIHIELGEPLEGRTVFDIRFPDTPRSPHDISISLGGSAWVNVGDILRHYDNCIANSHDYHNGGDEGVSAYEQARLILGRLKDPIMLTPFNKSVFDRIIREHLVEICVDVARHDDRAVVDDLCDFGFLNENTVEDAVVAVGRLQDAAMSGYLLELKRRRFGRAAFDYDL